MTGSHGSAPAPPGWPGIPPRWTTSAKSGLGTALGVASRVWFTVSHGILNELYYPRVDQACTRDLGLIVTDGRDFFSEEKRDTESRIEWAADGVPAFRVVNTCRQGRYRIEKCIVADPRRDVVLQRIRFVPLREPLADHRLFALLAPHLANRGSDNDAWVGEHKGVPMLFAGRDGIALALACSAPWVARSAGFVGTSDGWQDLVRHREMRWTYEAAREGNVALTGEIALGACAGEFVLAVAFGRDAAEAGHRARASLLDGFEAAWAAYVRQWEAWQEHLLPIDGVDAGARGLYRVSAAVLRIHEAKRFPGGLIASLSIPWGDSKGDEDLGGYHLVWPRDLAEAAGGLLAAGAAEDACRVLRYLHATQEPDGHWPQNMWLDGTPYWSGIQMDETAFPILLADLARREHALAADDLARLWPMVREAAGFLVRNGPVTQQDRWEEDAGYSPFTLAVEIAALLAAADFAELSGEPGVAGYLRETADTWNDAVERWTYVTDTPLARRCGVAGHYVRIAAADTCDGASPLTGFVPIKNRPPGESRAAADHIVSPDALALVRFGLRAADDPRIVNTVTVIDAVLEVELPAGPAWHRYNGDGYGEHSDGTSFDGTGQGRAWPLLTGERAHYALAAGRMEEARRLLRALEGFANEGGMIPEQVWDAPDNPERELRLGRPSGSAMPLVWAHAECVKLWRSLRDGRVFDMPPQPLERYVRGGRQSPHAPWRFNHKCRAICEDRRLRLEVLAPAVVRWSADDWRTVHDSPTGDTALGVHVVDVPRQPAGTIIRFTFFWTAASRWEGADFSVQVAGATPVTPAARPGCR